MKEAIVIASYSYSASCVATCCTPHRFRGANPKTWLCPQNYQHCGCDESRVLARNRSFRQSSRTKMEREMNNCCALLLIARASVMCTK